MISADPGQPAYIRWLIGMYTACKCYKLAFPSVSYTVLYPSIPCYNEECSKKLMCPASIQICRIITLYSVVLKFHEFSHHAGFTLFLSKHDMQMVERFPNLCSIVCEPYCEVFVSVLCGSGIILSDL